MNALTRFNKQFGRRHALLPVVHCIDEGQVNTAVDVALSNGADGVWLINQGGMTIYEVVGSAVAVAERGCPFVGVNLLGCDVPEAIDVIANNGSIIDGVWSDNARMHLDNVGHESGAHYGEVVRAKRQWFAWQGLYFGGVAFKYQRPVPPEQWGATAKYAAPWVDVITTSGEGTGIAAPPEKLRAMRDAIGDHPLALASGVTPDNIGDYLDTVDAFLVSTGIEQSFGVFDPAKVKALAQAIHGG